MTTTAGLNGDSVTASPEPTLSLFGGRGRLLVLGAAVLVLLWLARGYRTVRSRGSPGVRFFAGRLGGDREDHAPRALIVGLGYVLVLGLIAVLAVVAAERPDRSSSTSRPGVGRNRHPLRSSSAINSSSPARPTRPQFSRPRSGPRFWHDPDPSGAIHMAEPAVDRGAPDGPGADRHLLLAARWRRFGQFALRFLDRSQRADALRIGHRIHVVLGRWLRGQMLLIGLVAVSCT